MRKVKIIESRWIIIIGLASVILISCRNNEVISKTYGSDSKNITIIDDAEIKCTFAQVIYGSSCMSNIYLTFIPKSNSEIDIKNVNGQMSWNQNGLTVRSPFLLSHITPELFINDDGIQDSSHKSSMYIAEKFRKISGINNSLLYNMEFSDSTYNNIPINVDKVIIDLEIRIATNGNMKQYTKSVVLDAVTHHMKIPIGRND